MARNASKAICTLLVLRFYYWVCLGIRHSDSVAQMLLDQSRRASCDRGRLYDSEMKFLSNAYTNPNTNPKTLTTGILTLNDCHDAFESFNTPVFYDFIRNYFLSDSETFGLLDTSLKYICLHRGFAVVGPFFWINFHCNQQYELHGLYLCPMC